jgi:hypothetical protein
MSIYRTRHADALRVATDRVIEQYTRAGLLFTSLDVSNAVKHAVPAARHREIAALVREAYARGAMGDYARTPIEVFAEGETPATAYLYHSRYAPAEYYDGPMRAQRATPPVARRAGARDRDAPAGGARDGDGAFGGWASRPFGR